MGQAGLFDCQQARPVRVAGAVTKLPAPCVPDVAAAKRRYDAACAEALRLYVPSTSKACQSAAWSDACQAAADLFTEWRDAKRGVRRVNLQ